MRKLFQGLHWKLTLSYTVVTVVTLLVVEILLITGVSFLIINFNILPGLLISAIDIFISPQVADYLDQPEPDMESLALWLEQAYADGITFHSSQNPSLSIHLGDLDQATALLILDQNLDQLAMMPEMQAGSVASILEETSGLLEAAQRGERDASELSEIADGFLTVAVPVNGQDDRVLGVVMMVTAYPPSGSFIQALSLVGVSFVFFILVTGFIGTVFGFITARGFTRRLRGVSRAADAWSQGDFSTFIQDRSSDELGQTARQLNRMAEQLQNLMQARQDLAALEERNRLARDLHDSVKQQVFAASMQLGAAHAALDQDAGEARKHLEEALKLIRQSQAELETLIRELRPMRLQEDGLAEALRAYLTEWSRRNAIHADLDVRGAFLPSPEVEQALFRVAQEALANVARHSEAARVGILLVLDRQEASLRISDDGKGFDPTAVVGVGMGLHSMRERMGAVGGRLVIESAPGTGTKITARCPVGKEEPHE